MRSIIGRMGWPNSSRMRQLFRKITKVSKIIMLRNGRTTILPITHLITLMAKKTNLTLSPMLSRCLQPTTYFHRPTHLNRKLRACPLVLSFSRKYKDTVRLKLRKRRTEIKVPKNMQNRKNRSFINKSAK